jgi:hypothetical protein
VGRFGKEFVDGATGADNPVREVWDQAQLTWGPEPLEGRVKCLVSIGTGVPSLEPFKDDVLRIGETLVAIATETEVTAERFRRERGLLDSTYKEAEAMHRQTLALEGKVLGHEHPNTLTSVYCLAHLLAHQHRYYESLALYDRASAGYQAVLGQDHPTTCACCQQYAGALASQEQGQLAISPTIADSDSSARSGKGLKLLRRLAKMGIRSSKLPAR